MHYGNQASGELTPGRTRQDYPGVVCPATWWTVLMFVIHVPQGQFLSTANMEQQDSFQ